jgi:hypothetical protein
MCSSWRGKTQVLSPIFTSSNTRGMLTLSSAGSPSDMEFDVRSKKDF